MISVYDMMSLYGESLMTWAVRWFNMSNDAFYKLYGFNFNPHKYPGLYEQARRRVYPNAWGDSGKVELEINGERYTVVASELISAVKRATLNSFGE